MTDKSNNQIPMLSWSDYFNEEDSGAAQQDDDYYVYSLSKRMLAYAIALSSVFWGFVLIASHLVL